MTPPQSWSRNVWEPTAKACPLASLQRTPRRPHLRARKKREDYDGKVNEERKVEVKSREKERRVEWQIEYKKVGKGSRGKETKGKGGKAKEMR